VVTWRVTNREGLLWLKRRPVTPEVAGSSAVGRAISTVVESDNEEGPVTRSRDRSNRSDLTALLLGVCAREASRSSSRSSDPIAGLRDHEAAARRAQIRRRVVHYYALPDARSRY